MIKLTLTSCLIRTVAIAALIGSVGFAAPLYAQTADDTTAATAAEQAAPAGAMTMQPAPPPPGEKGDMRAHVEQRIKTLHDKLKITQNQESNWSKVADTMRDNEAAMEKTMHDRHQNPESQTAIDDMQSYQKIVQAHADGMQKMVDAFKTVYDEMSDDQKKNADTVFSKFEGHEGHHHPHGKKHDITPKS
jgi:hypothetical protein